MISLKDLKISRSIISFVGTIGFLGFLVSLGIVMERYQPVLFVDGTYVLIMFFFMIIYLIVIPILDDFIDCRRKNKR